MTQLMANAVMIFRAEAPSGEVVLGEKPYPKIPPYVQVK